MDRTGRGTDIVGLDVAGPRDAPPIVFVHGAVFTRKMWLPQSNALSNDYRTIAVDLPGHGVRADGQFRLRSALALLDDVLEQIAGGRALVVGISLGGYVATAYASRHPDRIDGLVISGSTANPVDSLEILTRAVAGGTRLLTRSKRVQGLANRLAARWVRERDLDPEVRAAIVAAGFYPRQFGVAGPELAGRDFRGAFASYPGPALIVNGSRDLLNRRGESAHAAAASDARVERIGGVGHVCNLYRPVAYTSTVRRFHRRSIEPTRAR